MRHGDEAHDVRNRVRNHCGRESAPAVTARDGLSGTPSGGPFCSRVSRDFGLLADPLRHFQTCGRPSAGPRPATRASGRRGAPARPEVQIVTPSVPPRDRRDAYRCRPVTPCRTAHDLDRHRGRSTARPHPPESCSSTLSDTERPTEAIPSAVLLRRREETQPRSISMIAEKSRPPWPCLSNRSKSWAASAPSGVAAPAARAASCASFRSFSIKAAAKPGL